jgi:hypothetical protein
MISTLWVLIKSLFKKKEINKSPKFKVGDELKIDTEMYKNREGVVLEVVKHSIDNWIYQVEIKMDSHERTNFPIVQYFNENELDYTLWKKRDDRLKELGI